MSQSGIYQIRNMATGKCYVGSAVSILKRWREHRKDLRKGEHQNRYLQRAWDKYGEATFAFEVLEAVEDPKNLLVAEQVWLDKQGHYNIARIAGSNLGIKMSPETLKRMSESKRGKRQTDEDRAKKSLAAKNRSPEAKARVVSGIIAYARSEAGRRVRSENLKGKPKSAEHRAALSAAKTGKKLGPQSPEHLARRIAALKNKPPISEETRAKLRAAQQKRWHGEK